MRKQEGRGREEKRNCREIKRKRESEGREENERR